ncbi:MAG: hypothetical protein V1718_01750 [archaeon]
MDSQYSGMADFRNYMDKAEKVCEKIVTELPGTYNIHSVTESIQSTLSFSKRKDPEILEEINDSLNERFSSVKRQKCPEMDIDRQVPCMMEQLYVIAIKLEALKHYEKSIEEQSDHKAELLGSTCDFYISTYNLIKADYGELVKNGAEFNQELIAEIDELYREDTLEYFKTRCPTLKDIIAKSAF